MNGSIISLIQENRKLFYKGYIRNTYKSDFKSDNRDSIESKQDSTSLKQKSFRLLQEIFNE